MKLFFCSLSSIKLKYNRVCKAIRCDTIIASRRLEFIAAVAVYPHRIAEKLETTSRRLFTLCRSCRIQRKTIGPWELVMENNPSH